MTCSAFAKCVRMKNMIRISIKAFDSVLYSNLIIIPKSIFFAYLSQISSVIRRGESYSRHVECRMITQEIWNYYMFRKSFSYDNFSGGCKHSVHTQLSVWGNRWREKESSNMKDINEVIKVKRNPIQCYSWKPNKQTNSKKFSHFFSLRNVFFFFTWNRNESFCWLW